MWPVLINDGNILFMRHYEICMLLKTVIGRLKEFTSLICLMILNANVNTLISKVILLLLYYGKPTCMYTVRETHVEFAVHWCMVYVSIGLSKAVEFSVTESRMLNVLFIALVTVCL